jgi:hypothetical protein
MRFLSAKLRDVTDPYVDQVFRITWTSNVGDMSNYMQNDQGPHRFFTNYSCVLNGTLFGSMIKELYIYSNWR